MTHLTHSSVFPQKFYRIAFYRTFGRIDKKRQMRHQKLSTNEGGRQMKTLFILFSIILIASTSPAWQEPVYMMTEPEVANTDVNVPNPSDRDDYQQQNTSRSSTASSKFRVAVIVSGDDSIKSRVKSYLSRELRNLGDVIQTKNNYEYEISVVTMAVRNKNGYKTGVVLSTNPESVSL